MYVWVLWHLFLSPWDYCGIYGLASRHPHPRAAVWNIRFVFSHLICLSVLNEIAGGSYWSLAPFSASMLLFGWINKHLTCKKSWSQTWNYSQAVGCVQHKIWNAGLAAAAAVELVELSSFFRTNSAMLCKYSFIYRSYVPLCCVQLWLLH